LVVDDNFEEADAKRILMLGEARVIPRVPSDVTVADLRAADLVLLDLVLDDWPFDPSRSPAEHPKDGVALAAVLRSHSDVDQAPTAFALHSGKLDGLSGGLPPRSHLHVIARANNLEWVFSKSDDENSCPMQQQVLALASGLRQLPKTWPTAQHKRMRSILEGLLGLKQNPWRDRAWQDIERCNPPIQELSPPTHGVTFVRWLLHRILPYPTFLWDRRYLAARLRVTPGSLKHALSKDSSLRRRLLPFKYKGVLEGFLGERWWRAGIEHWLWQATKASAFDAAALRKSTRGWSRHLEPVTLAEPVVVLDAELRAVDDLVDLSQAVPLQPDDWPAYADRPWARRDLTSTDNRMKSLAVGDSD
jgi:hypothetical protein